MPWSDERVFRAYDELRVDWPEGVDTLKALTPWISLSVEVEPEGQETLREALRELHAGARADLNDGVQQFLGALAEYPVSFVRPRSLGGTTAIVTPANEADALAQYSPQGLVESMVAEFADAASLCCSNGHPVSVPESWQWPVDEVLDMARIANEAESYDPITIFGLLRRLSKLTIQDYRDQGLVAGRLEELLGADETRFFRFVSNILSQSYFITNRCQSSLLPALHFLPARDLVDPYIREEKGHHRLIGHSLRALGISDLSSLEVLPETVLCMATLKLAAARHFLGFCCCVGAFEGSAYAPEDPIGSLLRRSSRPFAASGIDRHLLINQRGGHAAVGQAFAERLGPVTRGSALNAARLAEMLATLQNSLATHLLCSC